MLRTGERFSSKNVFGSYMYCVTVLQVRVQCWPLQDMAVEPDKPKQSKEHQEAHSGQEASWFAELSTFSW